LSYVATLLQLAAQMVAGRVHGSVVAAMAK